jgi:hypothetical protein
VNGWILVRTWGDPTDEELLAGVERILSDPELPANPRFLSDGRDVEIVASPTLVRRVLEVVARFPDALEGARIALVAAGAANYGMQRMLSMRAESMPLQIRVFSDLEQAMRWLEAE